VFSIYHNRDIPKQKYGVSAYAQHVYLGNEIEIPYDEFNKRANPAKTEFWTLCEFEAGFGCPEKQKINSNEKDYCPSHPIEKDLDVAYCALSHVIRNEINSVEIDYSMRFIARLYQHALYEHDENGYSWEDIYGWDDELLEELICLGMENKKNMISSFAIHRETTRFS
jgi:hypothetical protein